MGAKIGAKRICGVIIVFIVLIGVGSLWGGDGEGKGGLVELYGGEIHGRGCEREVKRAKDLLSCNRYFIKSRGGKTYEIRNMDRGKIQLFLKKKKKRKGYFEIKNEKEKEEGLDVWKVMKMAN